MTEIIENDFLDLFRQICHAERPFRASFLDEKIIGRFAEEEEADLVFSSGREAEQSEEAFDGLVELVVGGRSSLSIMIGSDSEPIVWERLCA